jgi:hypothetical protein
MMLQLIIHLKANYLIYPKTLMKTTSINLMVIISIYFHEELAIYIICIILKTSFNLGNYYNVSNIP